MATITLEIKGLDRLKKNLDKAPELIRSEMTRAIKNSVNIIRPLMVRQAPVQTSKLRQNIYAKASGLSGEVGVDTVSVPYALYVHMGTRPHTIYPKTKKALYWKGALHPVRKVNHPGTKANPFVERTAEEVKQPVNKIFQDAVDRVLKHIS